MRVTFCFLMIFSMLLACGKNKNEEKNSVKALSQVDQPSEARDASIQSPSERKTIKEENALPPAHDFSVNIVLNEKSYVFIKESDHVYKAEKEISLWREELNSLAIQFLNLTNYQYSSVLYMIGNNESLVPIDKQSTKVFANSEFISLAKCNFNNKKTYQLILFDSEKSNELNFIFTANVRNNL